MRVSLASLRPARTALLVCILVACSAAQDVPKGWHHPESKLTRQDFRKKDPKRFLRVDGDFNGDGIQDQALLLVSQDGTKLGFFVCLRGATGCSWHRLEAMDIAFIDVMGIALVKPSKTKTACGKGYWECGNDETETLLLKHDAVEFFKDESASSTYFFDSKTHRFKAVAISD